MVWSLALEDKEDLERFKELGWGLRTWDQWEWNDCDKRFGDDWPGRIPAQLIAHILFYFSKLNDLILDPKNISSLPMKEYLEYLEAFLILLKLNAKKTTRLAFINASHPHYPGPHVRTALQCSNRLRNAKKKDTRHYKQIRNSSETTRINTSGRPRET